MIPQAACCRQIKYQAGFLCVCDFEVRKDGFGVVSEKHSWGYKRLEKLSLGLSAMLDRQNATATISLGEREGFIDYHPSQASGIH